MKINFLSFVSFGFVKINLLRVTFKFPVDFWQDLFCKYLLNRLIQYTQMDSIIS